MRKFILPVAFAALMATTGVAAAGHDGPGTRGEKNCVGQTLAYFAQNAPAVLVAHPGLGGFLTFSAQQLQELARMVCGAGE